MNKNLYECSSHAINDFIGQLYDSFEGITVTTCYVLCKNIQECVRMYRKEYKIEPFLINRINRPETDLIVKEYKEFSLKEQNLFKCTVTIGGSMKYVYIVCKDMHDCYDLLREEYNVAPTEIQQLNVDDNGFLIKE